MLSNIQSSSALVKTSTMLGRDNSCRLLYVRYSVEMIKLRVIYSPLLFVSRYIVNHFGLEIDQLILRRLLILSLWRFLSGSRSSVVGCWKCRSRMLDSRLNQHCVIGENFDRAAMKSIRFSLIHPCWLAEHNPWKGVLCMVWPSTV